MKLNLKIKIIIIKCLSNYPTINNPNPIEFKKEIEILEEETADYENFEQFDQIIEYDLLKKLNVL